MTLQNRVTPRGEIEAHATRGLFMGNRGGRLHDDARRLGRRRWTSKAWLICVLAFKGRRRTVMGPGYTELFFLDEAVALAAGHRPCFECRRADALRFRDALGAGSAPEMDATLHGARLGRDREPMDLAILPDGAFVEAEQPMLVLGDRLLPWSPSGYGPSVRRPAEGQAIPLTPRPALRALEGGYRPILHPSVGLD